MFVHGASTDAQRWYRYVLPKLHNNNDMALGAPSFISIALVLPATAAAGIEETIQFAYFVNHVISYLSIRHVCTFAACENPDFCKKSFISLVFAQKTRILGPEKSLKSFADILMGQRNVGSPK